MNYLMIRHKIGDFKKWKPEYDDSLTLRKTAGLKEVFLWHNLDNPNEIVLLFEASDIAKAKQFSTSLELKEKMQQAGVVGPPDIVFFSDK